MQKIYPKISGRDDEIGLQNDVKGIYSWCKTWLFGFLWGKLENHTVKTLQISLVLIGTKLKSMLEFFINAS